MTTLRNLSLGGLTAIIGLAIACTNNVEPESVNAAAEPKSPRPKTPRGLMHATPDSLPPPAKRSTGRTRRQSRLVGTVSTFASSDGDDMGTFFEVQGLSLGDTLESSRLDGENYAAIEETGFVTPTEQPLSTFGIDVDTAAYTNLQRVVRSGYTINPDAVRIEELVNYFDYGYEGPKGEVPFAVGHEVAPCPWNPDHLLARVHLQGKRVPMSNLPPMNLVFLIDTSGSMEDELPLIKSGFRAMLETLRPTDRVAIVAYASTTGLILPSTRVSESERILTALNRLTADGYTAGGEGIQLAYRVAQEQHETGTMSRVLLATDGDFNVGIQSEGELQRLIEDKRKSGIFLSTLGFGMGNYDDVTMETLANHGNGNYSYIASEKDAKRALVTRLAGTLLTIAKDVKLQVEFNPEHVQSYRLIGYENRTMAAADFRDDRKDGGELGSGHSVTAFYEIIPSDATRKNTQGSALKYQSTDASKGTALRNELMTVNLRYKAPEGHESTELSHIVQHHVTETPSPAFRFAASVVEMGLVVRESKLKGNASLKAARERLASLKGSERFYESDEAQSLRSLLETIEKAY